MSDLQTLESLHGLSQRRVRIELDALVTRLGGLQLRDRGLEKITRELLRGDYARAVPQLHSIVNEGAKESLIVGSVQKCSKLEKKGDAGLRGSRDCQGCGAGPAR